MIDPGIQTAPALSILASALVLNRGVDEHFSSFDLDPGALAPSRL